MADLYGDLQEIFDYGEQIASPSRRIVACNYLDQILFAHPQALLLAWDGIAPKALLCPGLPFGQFYNGVSSFQGFAILWYLNRLKWSTQDDFTEWIPVGSTAASFVFTLQFPFTMPMPGVESALLYVNETNLGLVTGQFMRIDDAPYYSFFLVGTVLPVTGAQGFVSGFHQKVAAGAVGNLYLNAFVPYLLGAQLYFKNSAATMQLNSDAVDPGAGVLSVVTEFVNPPAGQMVTVAISVISQFSSSPYVSIGPDLNPGRDVFFVQSLDLVGGVAVLQRVGVGATSPTSHLAGELIVPQPYISVLNISGVDAVGSFLTPLMERFGFTMIPQNLTQAAPAGTVFPIGQQVFTLDANGAGESVNEGAGVNGDIWQFITLSDYGYIFKHRSVQSVQFTGIGNGTFFIRPEITTEGLFGKYSFVKVGEDLIYFWGNRQIYKFQGGNQLEPIAQGYIKQLMTEVDRTKAHEITGYHNEDRFEIWFIYPSKLYPDRGCSRIFIYNYVDNSVTIDDYSQTEQALTAVGQISWSDALMWAESQGSWVAPLSWPASAAWEDIDDDVLPTYNILASAGNPTLPLPQLLVQGQEVYDRKGAPYSSEAQTADFDAGDSEIWKYCDTVLVSLQIKVMLAGPANLQIFVGSKKNYDDDIVWSNPGSIDVQGNANYTTKVDIQRAGKFFRLRILSDTAGIQWRISSFRIMGRKGANY